MALQHDLWRSIVLPLQCSTQATCDSLTGRCLDESGQPGCFRGWTDGTRGACSRRGCPKQTSPACNNNTGGSCECAGYGTCNDVTGICACIAGRIGNNCFQTDCPGAPRCSGSAVVGVCDTTRGVCECAAGVDDAGSPTQRVGPACEALFQGPRPAPSLYFYGEVDPVTNMTGTVSLREWAD